VPEPETTHPADGPPQSFYDEGERPEVAAFVPDGIRSLLDVGCAAGGFGSLVRRRFGEALRLVGVDPVERSCAIARERGYDEVVQGYFPQALGSGERFDCIVFNDVLEHILEPAETLRAARDHLTDRGVVVASLPNIVYLPVLARIVLRRRWDYTQQGTLDRTHVRFFTKANMVELFESAGYRVVTVQGVNNEWYTGRWGRVKRLAPLVGEYQWLQFVLVGRPT
jgi:2-polyprenyl-3-methyl-5-hydroxy-6-metoxy-1,4-benzoquinol methylase